jgi:FkbH-like protein
MKLAEALRIVQQKLPPDAVAQRLYLACGFTPSQLQTFLAAHLRRVYPEQRMEIATGIFGDVLGSLAQLPRKDLRAAAVILEWADFDARLGWRQLGGWGPSEAKDIVATVRGQVERAHAVIAGLAETMPVVLCLPTLPLPPIGHLPGYQAGPVEWQLRECVHVLAGRLAEHPAVKLVNPQRLDRVSPLSERHDPRGEILFGLPYQPGHASIVAELLAQLLKTPAPKKGLITDLDDTLWSGLLGEVGRDGIAWDLDHHAQLHGLYQQVLRALAESGVLIAVASKNDSEQVAAALARPDLLLPRERIFPIEAHWSPKSESVTRILRAWNVAADSVVFLDDSPMEVAEVQAAHPGIEGIVFPKNDYDALPALLERLRDLFGKPVLSEEDSLRLASLRHAATLIEAAGSDGAALDRFLEHAEAEIILDFDKKPDPRVFELLNKTNQFNLNGQRFTEGDWQAWLHDPTRFVGVVSYQDKFGPLGKIAVLAGRTPSPLPSPAGGEGASARRVQVECWVMSCRAFARRIEHRCLEQLFARFQIEEIAFQFRPTPKNGPLQAFFEELLGRPPEPGCRLPRSAFLAKCPQLFHRITELTHA